jgi:hypothetical protein
MQATLNIRDDYSTDNQTNGSFNDPASAGPSLGGRLIKSLDGKLFQSLQFSPQIPQDCPMQIPQSRALRTPSVSTESPSSPKSSHTVFHSDYTVVHSNPQKSVRKRGCRAGPLTAISAERARNMRRLGACWPCRFAKVQVS